MTPGSSARRRPVVPAVAAAMLYLATGVALPLLHASTETVVGTAGIEHGHSEFCGRIHSDTLCVTVVAFQLPAQGSAPIERAVAETRRLPALHSTDAPRPTTLTFLFVRAPPIA